ncbi:MAG: ADP-ribosylglycohydrolase family protein [Lawsonella clevelandensis]
MPLRRRRAGGGEHFQKALRKAVPLGHDTDTVASIAGALLGHAGRFRYSCGVDSVLAWLSGVDGLRSGRLVNEILAAQ